MAQLERAFGVSLRRDAHAEAGIRMLIWFFGSTLRSYLAVRSPTSGYLEAGALFNALDRSGLRAETDTRLARIAQADETSRQEHLELLDLLLRAILGERAEETFTEDDLAG